LGSSTNTTTQRGPLVWLPPCPLKTDNGYYVNLYSAYCIR
jgi:hypothetical protein